MRDHKIDLARSHSVRGQHDQAINLLKNVLAETPDDAEAHALLALNLLACFRIYAAEHELGIALQLAPNDPTNFWIQGNIFTLQNKPRRVIESANECLRLEPEYQPALLQKYEAYMQLGQYKEAKQSVEHALTLSANDSDTLLAYADYYYRTNNKSAAEEYCIAVLAKDAQHEDANILMGNIKLAQNNFEDAEYHAKFVILNNPNSHAALNLLANIKVRKSKTLGTWWWLNSKIAQLSPVKSATVLISGYLLFTLLSQVLLDLGYPTASNTISYAWLGLAVYSWVAIPMYYRALKSELQAFSFNKNF